MSLTPLQLATIIGGLSGFLALALALLQWYLFFQKQRPKVRLALPSNWEQYLRCHPLLLHIPVLFTNYRQIAVTVIDITCKVKVDDTKMDCIPIKSRILATTTGEPEEDDVPTESRPFFQVEPYGCRLILIIFEPWGKAHLPIGRGKVCIQCGYVPGKKTRRSLKIPIQVSKPTTLIEELSMEENHVKSRDANSISTTEEQTGTGEDKEM